MTTVAGSVNKGANIESSSLETYYSGSKGIYNFNFNFEHDIPLGGYIRVNLPDEMSVGFGRLLAAYCYRINFANAPINLKCTMKDPNAFEIQLTYAAFCKNGSCTGLPAKESF